MKATNTAYNLRNSLLRIDEILMLLILISKTRIAFLHQDLHTKTDTMYIAQQSSLIYAEVVI